MKKTTVTRFISYLWHFGPRLAWYYFVYPRYGGSKAILRRHGEIKRWLKRKYKPILDKYRDIEIPTLTLPDTNRPIWFCWLQGESEMPQLVKLCYQSVMRNAAGRPLHLVTERNLAEFVKVDPIITKRLAEGKISRTHFADYLRLCLLSTHGGLWLDATVYVTGKIDFDIDYPFYTVKNTPESIHYVSEYRWAVSALSVSNSVPLCDAVKYIFEDYLMSERPFVDFFLFDYIIAIIYEEVPFAQKLIDIVPMNNSNYNKLAQLLNNKFDESEWHGIRNSTSLHKLNNKIVTKSHDVGQALTYYEKLIKMSYE